MEERQHGQHMIVRGEAVHVLAHHPVPQQRLLPQHRALGPSGGARGVDDQQRTGEIGMRIAAVAARARQQRVECASPRRRKIEPDDAGVGQALFQRGQNLRKGLFEHQHLDRGVRQDEQLFGHRKPPVQRHQHGAEPRAGIEQHQIVGPVQAEDRDAIAAADAEFGLQRARCLLDASTETPRSSRISPSKMIAGLSGVNAAFRSMRSERSIFELVVQFAGLVQRFAADAVETEFGGPRQHQRTAAAVAIDPLQRQRFQHRLAAAGADRQRRDLVGAFHRGILRGIGAQHLLLGWDWRGPR